MGPSTAGARPRSRRQAGGPACGRAGVSEVVGSSSWVLGPVCQCFRDRPVVGIAASRPAGGPGAKKGLAGGVQLCSSFRAASWQLCQTSTSQTLVGRPGRLQQHSQVPCTLRYLHHPTPWGAWSRVQGPELMFETGARAGSAGMQASTSPEDQWLWRWHGGRSAAAAGGSICSRGDATLPQASNVLCDIGKLLLHNPDNAVVSPGIVSGTRHTGATRAGSLPSGAGAA